MKSLWSEGKREEHEGDTHGRSGEEAERTPQARKRPQCGGLEPRYDETKRRHGARRARWEPKAYMERASAGYSRLGAKRRAIEVGATILARAAEGKYDWRDAGMKPVKRQRQQHAQPGGGAGSDEGGDAPGATERQE